MQVTEIDKRLENCRRYLIEAEKRNDPSDVLYIEDLKATIQFFENAIKDRIPAGTIIMGFEA